MRRSRVRKVHVASFGAGSDDDRFRGAALCDVRELAVAACASWCMHACMAEARWVRARNSAGKGVEWSAGEVRGAASD